jgi:ectoine hydroxylase-related dioxygenase (phytanoyl-CoA dioxygenase family)
MLDTTGFDTAQFHELGYAPPVPLLSATECAEAVEEIRRVLRTPGPAVQDERGHPDPASCRHLDTELFRSLCAHPGVVERVLAIFGTESATIFTSRVWFKEPTGIDYTSGYAHQIIPWHQDNTYFPIEPRVSVNAWFALTDTTPENGTLQLVPGSHRSLLPVREDPDWPFTEPAELESIEPITVSLSAGECLLFDGGMLHASGPNHSDAPRVGIATNFAPPHVKVAPDWFFSGHRCVSVP